MAEKQIPYTLERSRRARYMRVIVFRTGEVKVVAPPIVSVARVEQFVSKKSEWIVRTREKFLKRPVTEIGLLLSRRSRREYLAHKGEALRMITERLHHFNVHYNFSFKNITIRDQQSRWGSCTKQGNLSFNYKLLFLPAELRDYIVVHELCHLKELNHGKAFWDLVAEVVPNYKELRRKLRGVE